MTARGSSPTRVTSAASIATSAPLPIATPRSAPASAGASLIPSPTIATRRPAAWSVPIDGRLVARQHLRPDALDRDADLSGDRLDRRLLVAADEPDLVSGPGQRPNRFRSLRPDRIGDLEEPGQATVDRDEDRGPAARRRRGAGLRERLEVDPPLPEQARRADQDVVRRATGVRRVHDALDPVSGQGREPGNRPEAQLAAATGSQDRGPDRVLAPALQRRGQVEHLGAGPRPGRRRRRRRRADRGSACRSCRR